MSIRKFVLIAIAAVAALFLLIQIVPYGRAHDNPPVVQEPNWDSPQTRELAQRACFDCHSNETVWPWYANVAPVSWVMQNHVTEGRQYLNFSQWGQGEAAGEPEEVGEVVLEGEMPTRDYLLMHPEARLTEAEKAALVDGLMATAGQSPVAGGEHGESDEHEGDDD